MRPGGWSQGREPVRVHRGQRGGLSEPANKVGLLEADNREPVQFLEQARHFKEVER